MICIVAADAVGKFKNSQNNTISAAEFWADSSFSEYFQTLLRIRQQHRRRKAQLENGHFKGARFSAKKWYDCI